LPFRSRHLRYFVAVADAGQVTRAAQAMGVAQPALSQALGQLEDDLGLKLIERHGRGITLTAAGEAFLPSARAAVAAENDARATADELRRFTDGSIEFGFVGIPPALDRPELFRDFALEYPRVKIHFRELTFPSTSTASWIGSVDLAVCHLPPPDPEVWVRPLRREPRAVLMPADHPLARRAGLCAADIIDQTFVGFHPSVDAGWVGFWSLDDHRGGPARTSADQARNPFEILGAVSAGSGITTVPASVSAAVVEQLAAVATCLLDDAAPAEIVVLGRSSSGNPLADAFISYAAAREGARPPSGAASNGRVRGGA